VVAQNAEVIGGLIKILNDSVVELLNADLITVIDIALDVLYYFENDAAS
jgi:hypothetical protein